MVHLPERLGEIVLALYQHNLAIKRLRFVQPSADKAPNLLLLEAVKGGALTGMRHMPPLIVHRQEGGYTDELREIYGGTI